MAVASQSDWGPLDILILGAFHHEPCHINVGLNARPKGMRAVLHTIIYGFFWKIEEPKIEAPSRDAIGVVGMGNPQPIRGFGERRELPQQGPGLSPGRKQF